MARGLARSYLYVPGTDTPKMEKALGCGADAVICDLEDAVPAQRKTEALDNVREWIGSHPDPGAELWVRVNPGSDGLAELVHLIGCPGLAGVVLAKADRSQVREAVAAAAGSGLALSPLLETAEAVLDARPIAEAGVSVLQIGEYDLCADTGITPGPDEHETAWARAAVVFASRAAGLRPPIAPVSIEIRDTEAFATSTRRAARQGFVGRACIHPRQVDVVHQAFTPSEAMVSAARETLRRYESLEGSAVMVDDDGRLVDEATIRSARRTLALAADTETRSAVPG